MGDRSFGGQFSLGGETESLGGMLAQHVLHMHRIARAQECPVENGMDDERRVIRFLKKLETPGLNPLIPA